MTHPAVAARLERLAPDQRAAATAAPGPVLCVAPAGSGKTTTLVARIAWLIDGGASPGSICAVTFNKRAAEELRERVSVALEPLGDGLAGRVRIRTFHALGLEILRDAGHQVEPLLDRDEILATVRPDASLAELRRLDTVMSRLKLDLDVDPAAIEGDPEAGPVARTFAAYEREIARRGGLDFDDLVARALRVLSSDDRVLARWRDRCTHLLVDEAQDLDRSQLRLALLLAAPANRIFLVGDDDQSIYGWRLADVRRLLGLAESSLPGLARVDLEVNYRCPAPVLERSVRLIEHNAERFAKTIRAREGAAGSLVLAPSAADDVDRIGAVLASWHRLGAPDTFAVLARTNRELLPAAVAAVRLGIPFRAADLVLPIESPEVDRVLDHIDCDPSSGSSAAPLLIRIRRAPKAHLCTGCTNQHQITPHDRKTAAESLRLDSLEPKPGDSGAWGAQMTTGRGEVGLLVHGVHIGDLDATAASGGVAAAAQDILATLIGWAAACRDLGELRDRIRDFRERLAELRRDDAALTLATAHGTKGLEFDHVAVVGLDEGRFPSARSIAEAVEPERALEEERRLAYVAWTRARRSLTLVYDPGAPSQFLLEAFTPAELLPARPIGARTLVRNG